MTEEEYLKDRVDDQIKWYSRKSTFNKKMFNRIKIAEIAIALLIPVLVNLNVAASSTDQLKFGVSLLGVLVALLAGLMSLMKYQENWIEYRTTAESLKHEKYLFITKSGPYGDQQAFKRFVEHVEALISKENSQWSQIMGTQEAVKE